MCRELDKIDVLGEVPPDQRRDPFLSVKTLRLRNRYTDGSASREYLCDVVLPRWVDAVGVVLYDRDGDGVRVALKECLRPGILVRRELDLPMPDPDRSPFVLEIVAGRLEPGDRGWPGIARRVAEEAMEEAGLTVDPDAVRPLGPPIFTTPGTGPEKLYFAAAEVDASRPQAIRGDGSPMEDVGAVRFFPLADALAMCRSGEIEDGKTELALLRFKMELN